MAYHFTRHSTDSGLDAYLQTTAPIAIDQMAGFSVFARFRAEDVTQAHTILKIEFSNGEHYRIVASGDVANDPVRWISWDGENQYVASTTTGYTADTWHSVIACRYGGGSVSLDGAAHSAGLKISAGGNTPLLSISSAGVYRAIAGDVAEVAIWDVPMHLEQYAAVVAALAKGISPMTILPGNLLHYWDLTRGLQDRVGGCTLTAFNSPTVSEHPRVIP